MSTVDSTDEGTSIKSQTDLDLIASTIRVTYQVEDNLTGGRALFRVSVTLTNNCQVTLGYSPLSPWSIYFCHLRMVEPNYLPMDDSLDLEHAGIRLSHLNGFIFKMCPLESFTPLKEGDSLTITFNAQQYSASRSDILPNWYIHVDGLQPRIITSTEGESLDFVGPFDTPKRYKRFDYTLPSGKRRYDVYQPFTPEVRFFTYTDDKSNAADLKQVIPTPTYFHVTSDKLMNVDSRWWNITACDGQFLKEAKYLSEKSGISLSEKLFSSLDCDQKPHKIITLRTADVKLAFEKPLCLEAYEIIVDTSCEYIQISASEAAGAFYGVQTLLSLLAPSLNKNSGMIQDCTIRDAPRFQYRGMHVDVSRNFHSKEEILRLLDCLATYKMNKLHFHLTDDEGWRLEIPGLSELTEIGAKRGHDPNEDTCLLPMLGSGPFPQGLGCGFYSVEEYREILRYAACRHIEVIPEIDMPGHSHAAVRAMRVRYNKLMADNKKQEAEEYLLSELDNSVKVYGYSDQMMSENSMNPGLESTFTFIDKVIKELKEMHQDIQPLRVFHLGGDEVPYKVWDDSPACHALLESEQIGGIEELMEYFVTRVGNLAHKHGLDLGAWQDGIVEKDSSPYQRSKFPNSRVITYFWRNIWETGQTYDGHKLANAGYEVVLAPGTHMYFDHPYEPDPEERGLYWSCRYIDTHKVFRFAPNNLMSNADVKLTGEKITKYDLKVLEDLEDYTKLEKPQNITGLQGQIWTELIRTPEQFHSMIFPRLIALAERAWHKAPWEDMEISMRHSSLESDWSSFAHTLGHKELKRLEALNVPYHIPPPGARVSGDGRLELRSCYPGQPLSYSVDNGQTWLQYTGPVDVTTYDEILTRTSSHNGLSHSRVTTVTVQSYTGSDDDSN
uniref:beta-N-acetylhexosaminidase n=1 Tax=Arion vulgaris TaxID=1028688 RepID=A0A0B7ACD8_9EUPU